MGPNLSKQTTDISKPRRMTLAELTQQVKDAESLVVVCGAGLSYGVAPLADNVKGGLLDAVETLAAESETSTLHQQDVLELKQDYFTLELFVSGLRHRIPDLIGPVRKLYEEIFRLSHISRSHLSLAEALASFARAGKKATVLTANFDDGLTKALDRVEPGVPYRLLTRNNVASALNDSETSTVDICAYHGTVQDTIDANGRRPSGPTSMSARNLAHPFPPFLSQYVQQTLKKAGVVLFIGHRGEDFYDLNIELRRAVSEDDKQRGRFLCLPHQGDPAEVSYKTYKKLLGIKGLVAVDELSQATWVGDLFDAISMEKTQAPQAKIEVIGREGVKERLLELVEAAHPEGQLLKNQCAALLEDIRAGALGAWSTIEHYRLESIGYTQDEISAFGRASADSRFRGIPIAKLIDLQKSYQDFRYDFHVLHNPKSIRPEDGVFDRGVSLAGELEQLALEARKAAATVGGGMHRAIIRLLAAIPYDYCGLVGLRLMQVVNVPPIPAEGTPPKADLDKLMEDIDATSMKHLVEQAKKQGNNGDGVGKRTELLFRVSAALAHAASADLMDEAAKFFSDPDAQAEYAENLAQIVGWQDWELAPTENRLRLNFVDIGERLEGYRKLIDRRRERIQREKNAAAAVTAAASLPSSADGDSELSFSAAADAAQCAVRVCEVARLLAGTGDSGIIQPSDEVLERDDAKKLLEDIPALARNCIEVASSTSSVHNHLIMQAYDAILLVMLLKKEAKIRDIVSLLREAQDYARGEIGFQFETRLRGMLSRFGIDMPGGSR